MHILLMPSWYKTKCDPMLGSFFEEQARAFQRIGHQAGIIYPDFQPPSAFFKKMPEMPFFNLDNGLPTYAKFIKTPFPRMRVLNYAYHHRVTETIFKKYIKKYGMPDVIHSHSANHGGMAGKYIADKYNIPHIITEHLTTLISHSIVNDYDFKITREIFRTADKAIVVSHVFKDALVNALNLHPDYFEVVHNMANNLFFENLKPKKYVAGETFVFFTNSFLLKRKNHKLLFDSLKILVSKNIDVLLKVGGYGEEEEDLRNYVKQIGLENHVQFIGVLKREQVKEQLDSCHAFAIASIYETFGIVIIESLACGRPVVSTDSKGPRDIINAENGILVNSFDAADFADAMQSVMLNYSSYDQQEISQACNANFSEQSITKKLMAIYNDVIAKRKGGITPSKQKEKKNLLLTFDYELYLGTRSGFVEECLINPTKIVLQSFKKLNAKAIFFVDTTYLITLKENSAKYEASHKDFELISNQLQQIISEGHYVFPHLHPHWLDATYNATTNEWNVGKADKYRFHNITDAEREKLFRESFEILNAIILPIKNDYKLDAYRAGGWSIQPFDDFKPYYEKYNIKYDFSVLDKAYQFTNVQYYDYSSRPDKMIYKFDNEVCNEVANGRYTEFVNSTIRFNNKVQLKSRVFKKFNRLTKIDPDFNNGAGQVGVTYLQGQPKSTEGYPATTNGRFYLSADIISKAYMPSFKKFLADNYYMHFVNHPKLMYPYNMKNYNAFLKHAYDTYDIVDDFKKML